MSNIEKRIDKLGRMVLPATFRKKLGLETNSKVLLYLEDQAIWLTPAEEYCALCGSGTDIDQELRLCSTCITKIKNL